MIDYKETIKEMKKENTQLKTIQANYQDIVNYNATEAVIVDKVEWCRFLRDSGDPKFEE